MAAGWVRLIGRAGAVAGAAAALTVAALALASPAYAAATTLYVGGANCSDSGQGTQTVPYCTIGAAAAVASAGQTVMVRAGTYPEKVTVAHSGTAASPIVYTAASGATVTVTGGADGFVLSGRSYVTVNGFRITATTGYGITVSGSSHITISGNTVTGAGHPVSGQTAGGIKLSNTTASTVSGNTTNNNSSHGIYLAAGSSGNVVSGNQASGNAEGYRRNANGIDVIGPSNTVIRNVVHDNEDSGLQFYPGGNDNLATLNVSYNNGDHGIDDLNVTGGRLIGNTVYHNCTSGINVEGTSGSYTVEDNIAVDNAVYPAYHGIACSRRAGNIGIWDSAPPTTTVDNNLVYLSKSGTMYVFGTAFTSLAAMRAATGQEQHGVQGNPDFADASGGDFRLTEGSPAIDAANSGVSGEQSTDFLGKSRMDDPLVANTGSGPRPFDDIGAYEFQSTGTPQSPVAALTVSPGSGNAPLRVTADASGSHDPQGEALTYTFDFGDGTTVGPQAGATATHTYGAAGTFTVRVTVTDTSQRTGTAQAGVSVGTATGTNPAFVNQIATNSSTSTRASGSITVWRPAGVAAGDMEIVTVQLTGAPTTGTFSGVDDAGNTLAVAKDVSDGNGNRFAVLYGTVNTALAVNAKITVTFPGTATSYRITGDEVSGVTGVDRAAGAVGTAATFSSGATGTTSGPREFVFGAVAVAPGTSPAWTNGWTAETTYALGGNFMGRAYTASNATGSFSATGTTTGTWLAVCVTFD